MLVLTRLKGESLITGGDVKVTVLKVDRGKVRIGIEAPKEVKIVREEIYKGAKDADGDEASAPPRFDPCL